MYYSSEVLLHYLSCVLALYNLYYIIAVDKCKYKIRMHVLEHALEKHMTCVQTNTWHSDKYAWYWIDASIGTKTLILVHVMRGYYTCVFVLNRLQHGRIMLYRFYDLYYQTGLNVLLRNCPLFVFFFWMDNRKYFTAQIMT